mmetsp:Transcript_15843/g.45155  ORF Transcript_15843/g.45155 Transcript_15843/m.45155 type:complete len:204 (-) Transcript_15843:14-625(-)
MQRGPELPAPILRRGDVEAHRRLLREDGREPAQDRARLPRNQGHGHLDRGAGAQLRHLEAEHELPAVRRLARPRRWPRRRHDEPPLALERRQRPLTRERRAEPADAEQPGRHVGGVRGAELDAEDRQPAALQLRVLANLRAHERSLWPRGTHRRPVSARGEVRIGFPRPRRARGQTDAAVSPSRRVWRNPPPCKPHEKWIHRS